MNYKKNYFKLIEKAKLRKTDLPTEIHHILPRSLGGTDEETNLVKLTFREHYLAHYLLWKFTTGEEHKKMARALFVMSQNGKILSPECYEKLRAEICKKVICLQTLQIFDSAREAEKVCGIPFKNISTSCRLERSTKGYDFRFYEEGKEYEKIDMKPIHIQQNKKIICNETGEIFNSQKQLAEKLNIDRSNIKRYIVSGKPFRGLTYSFLKS